MASELSRHCDVNQSHLRGDTNVARIRLVKCLRWVVGLLGLKGVAFLVVAQIINPKNGWCGNY